MIPSHPPHVARIERLLVGNDTDEPLELTLRILSHPDPEKVIPVPVPPLKAIDPIAETDQVIVFPTVNGVLKV